MEMRKRENGKRKMEESETLEGAPVHKNIDKCQQIFAAIFACLLAMAVGTQMAWTTLLPILKNRDKLSELTNNEASCAGSLCAIGAIIGALPSGIMADKFGRKKSLMLLAVPFLLSWLIIFFASRAWMWYMARVIGGISVGGTCVLVPIYISEVAEISIRGTLGALFQLFLIFGIFLVYIFDLFFEYKILAVICALVEVAFLITFRRMPESPEWPLSKERTPEDEMEVFQNDSDSPSEQITIENTPNAEEAMELQELEMDSYNPSNRVTITRNRIKKKSFLKTIFDIIRCFKSRCFTPGVLKAFIYSCGAMIFQQLAGVNTIISNTLDIFDETNNSSIPDYANIIVSLIQMIVSGIATASVDSAGRKSLLMWSSGIVAVSLVILAIFFAKPCDGINLSWKLSLLSFFLFFIGFSIGLGPIPWMLTAELNNIKLKGIVSGIAVFSNWFLVYYMKKLYSKLIDNIGIKFTLGLMAIFMVLAFVLTFIFLPETKRKTNQEIQGELNVTLKDHILGSWQSFTNALKRFRRFFLR